MTVKMVKLNFKHLKTIIMTASLISDINSSDRERLGEFITSYYKEFENSIKHNGKNYTLTLFKAIHSQAVSLALHKEIQLISFHKSSRDGVSTFLSKVKPLLLSNDDKLIRLILTCTRVYEAIRLKPEFDPTSFTEGYKGEFNLDEFNKELECFLSKSRWFGGLKRKFKIHLKPITRTIGRLRSGPNGQAIITGHVDAVALKRTHLYNKIQDLNKHLGQSFLNASMDHCVMNTDEPTLGKIHTGKISLASERGGKTRLFALGDMWTMNCFQCIHDAGMKALRTLPTDSTFNQSKGFFRILRANKMSKWVGSADLTKATDRLPVSTLRTVLYALTDDQYLSDLWSDIMTNREFRYEDGTFKWSIGTPLGIISGWTIFAIAHHCLVQYSYNLTDVNTHSEFKDYQILGDDVCIWHKTCYDQYAMVLKGLGISISPEKSMKSVPGQFRFEFAKRIANNGRELTGFPFDLLHIASKSIYGYIDLVRFQVETNFYKDPLSFRVVPDYLNQKGKRYLSILLWEAELLCPSSEGNIAPPASRDALRRKIFHIQVMRLKETSERLDKVLTGELHEHFAKVGLVVTDQLLGHNGPGYHPVIESLNHTGLKLYEALDYLSIVHDADDLVTQECYPQLAKLTYLPLPHMGAYFERPGRRDPNFSRHHSELVLMASKQIRTDQLVVLEPSSSSEEDGTKNNP